MNGIEYSLIMQMSLCMATCFVSILVLLVMFILRRMNVVRYRHIVCVCVFAFLTELFESVYFVKLYDPSDRGIMMVHVARFCMVFFSAWLHWSASWYLISVLIPGQNRIKKGAMSVIGSCTVIYLILLTITPFYPILYAFEENSRSVRTPYTTFGFMCLEAIGLTLILVYLFCRKQVEKNTKIFWLVMYFGFCFSNILQGIYPNLNMAKAGIVCILVVIILYLQLSQRMTASIQDQMLYEKEKELTEASGRIALSQVKPHFMYNGLLSIRGLIEEEPEQAVEAVDYFMDYMRGVINALNASSPITLKEEMEFTQDYVALEQIRFGDDIQVDYQIEESDYHIPALTVQTLVENAIRHGIRKNSDGTGHVWIRAWKANGNHMISVKDDGIGFDTASVETYTGKEHTGLRNVRRRLELVCGGSMTLRSTPGEGTEITIRLPASEKRA